MKQFLVYLCCGSPENTLSRNHTTGTHFSLVFWKSTHKLSKQHLTSPSEIIKKNKSTTNQKKIPKKPKQKLPNKQKTSQKIQARTLTIPEKCNENTKFLTFVSDMGYQNKSLDKTAIPEEMPCLARPVVSSRPHLSQTPTREWDRKEGNWGVLACRQQQLWGAWEEVTEDGEWDRSQTGTGNSWIKCLFFPLRMTKHWNRAPGQLWNLHNLRVFKISLGRPWANWSSSRLIWLWARGWSRCCPRSLTLNNSAI